MKTTRYRDPVIEVYMRDVDRTLLRENLKLAPGERLEKFARFMKFASELREAGNRARQQKKKSARRKGTMNPPRSAYDQVAGMYHFPRMLDKIRLFAAGKLPPAYHANLGKGADGWCCGFLRIDYSKLRERVLAGESDEEILEWCYSNGRRLSDHDVWVWNQAMSRIGWRDAASKRLEQAKAENGLADRKDIVTMMDFFDADEGRKPQTR